MFRLYSQYFPHGVQTPTYTKSSKENVIDPNPTVRFKMTISSMLGFKIKIKLGLKLSRRYCYLPNAIDPNPTLRFKTIIPKLVRFKIVTHFTKS